MRDTSGQGGRVRPTEGQVRDTPFRGKKARGHYVHGSRVHTFDRQPNSPPTKNVAFSGKGFLPDLFASHAPVTLYEASATALENEGVHGREGMMPAAGYLGQMQPGTRPDEGGGGAGSFLTVSARNAKDNG